MKTRTGEFSLGFRRGESDWQKDLGRLVSWALEKGLEVIDLGRDGHRTLKPVVDAGLRVGSVDLPEWEGMMAPDKMERADAIKRNAAYVRACAAFGPMNHFVVMLPEKPELPRVKNFRYMVESFSELIPLLEEHSARLVIEGYPGGGSLVCTPEGFRAFFKQIPSKAVGVNYDPSHLIRMGIDPLRFLQEFGERVYHVHGKDTALLPENLYEYGTEQPAIFMQRITHGGFTWRYTIPGHGVMRWTEAFRMLKEKGYTGCVSVELEDANFHGSEEEEKLGILQGVRFLEGC